MPKFVHLHGHSEYSLLDGLCKIQKLVKAAKDLGFEALALTDHGVMYGAIEFYKACKEAAVKPIIGCEFYLAKRSHKDKEGKVDTEPFHLTVLAKNFQGYQNLMKLVTIAHLEGYYYRPRVDKILLERHHEGLIALSGCPSGEFIRSLETGDLKKASEVAKEYLEIFGEGNFFFELQSHPYQKYANEATDQAIKRDLERMQTLQEKTFKVVGGLAEKLSVPIVATNDYHYIKQEDAEAQDTLICVQTGKLLSDLQRLRMIDCPDYFLKSAEEMQQAFHNLPEALKNSVKIANSIDLEIPLGKAHFPAFSPPEGKSSMEYLKELTYQKAKEKLKITDEIKQRLEYELDIIEYKKYADYFLTVVDFFTWAHQGGIITNTRGSAAGSLVLYCLEVTNLNPLDYYLPFERFLTKFRPTLPDIDADLADDRRDEVIRYVMKKYGEDKVAHIVTFGTMMGRAAIRDVGRCLGISYGEVDRIAKLIPPPHQGSHMPIEQAARDILELRELYQNDAQVKRLLDLAKKLEGTVRHASVHAAGVVIAPDDITNFTPLQKEADGDKLVAQYDMFSITEEYGGAGLVKIDLLGIRNLSILGRAVEYVKQNKGVDVNINRIPLDDKLAFELLSKGETMGVFQLEGSGMTRYLTELKPTSIFDIQAMVALYRPGPMSVIPEYILRKHNPKKIQYFDPRMKDFTQTSLGLLVYQDDVLLTVINLAGYSWEEADKFRKAMGKKNPAEMAKQREKFVEGCVQNGMRREKAEELFNIIAPFAAYGFNKCLAGETVVYDAKTAERMTLESLYKSKRKPSLLSLESNFTLNPSSISFVQENGIKSVFEVTTRRGLRIKSTDNHPFLTVKGWRELKDLKVGGRIATSRYAPLSEQAYVIDDYKLVVLGYLLSEGNLCHPYGVYYYSTSKEEIEDFILNASQFENSRISLNNQKSAVSVYIGKKDLKKPNFLFKWLSELQLLNKKATEKVFPEFVFRLDCNQLSLLLAKMWQGDGLISPKDGGQFFYATSSKKLAFDMQHLLLRLGIISTVHTKGFKYKGKIMPGWTINISRYNNIQKFSETVGKYLIGSVKAACKTIVNTHPILSGDLSPISARGSKDIIPAEILSVIKEEIYITHPSLSSFATQYGVSIRLLCKNNQKIGYLRETIQNLAESLNSQKLHSLANSDIYWDEIVSIEPKGKEMTYDLTVPNTHNFVANDIIVHNSHAASYAMVAYQTAYMKANFPVEFMAAVMTAEYGNTDKIAAAIEDCQRLGIIVLPPDINQSKVGFTIEDLSELKKEHLQRQIGEVEGRTQKQGIRFGLSAIKNVGILAIESILKARRDGEFFSLADLVSKVDTRLVNRKTLESLIKAGALDSLGSRSAQLLVVDAILEKAHKRSQASFAGQVSLFESDEQVDGFDIKLPKVDELSLEQMLIFEKDLLGFYLHEPPYQALLGQVGDYCSHKISEVAEDLVGRRCRVGGVITEVKKVITKKSGAEMAFIRIFDGSAEIEAVIFPAIYGLSKEFLEKDRVILAWGRIDKREESLSLVCDNLSLFDPSTAQTLEKQLEINVPKGTGVETLQKINKTLREYPGRAKVSLILPNGGNQLRKMNLPFSVSATPQLLTTIESLLGEGSVKLT